MEPMPNCLHKICEREQKKRAQRSKASLFGGGFFLWPVSPSSVPRGRNGSMNVAVIC